MTTERDNDRWRVDNLTIRNYVSNILLCQRFRLDEARMNYRPICVSIKW